jgi:hypothetical protein
VTNVNNREIILQLHIDALHRHYIEKIEELETMLRQAREIFRTHERAYSRTYNDPRHELSITIDTYFDKASTSGK